MQDSRPRCPHCGTAFRQIRYGRSPSGRQKWQCHTCKRVYTPDPKPRGFPPELKHRAVRMYVEGLNFRRIGRLVGVSHQTVIDWVNAYHARWKAEHPKPPKPEEVETVELDELYAKLRKKGSGCM